MPQALAGRTVAVAEGRQLDDLVQLLEKEGAIALRCPMLSIQDAPDNDAIAQWLEELAGDRFGWVVLLTGEGLRRLLGFADRNGLRDRVLAGLRRTRTLTRGPKPVKALREVGLAPTKVAATPTTAGVIESLREEPLSGQVVGVQLYVATNPPLLEFLQARGAIARPVLPYVYAPATDADHVAALIAQLARGEVDVLVFTSSPQVDRLFDVAAERNLGETLRQGLERTRVAAVGPIVAENLARRDVTVAICPEQGFVMKNLVLTIQRSLEREAT